MKVEILGSGCKRCEQLYENAVSAATQVDPSCPVEVTKVNDINYFSKVGVFTTPALVIDGKVASVGKVLSTNEVKEKIMQSMSPKV